MSTEAFVKAYAERNGEGMAKAIGDLFNRFGSPEIKGMTDEEMFAMKLCGYLTLFELADWWERCECNGWDERKKASAIFAYRNKELLADQFKEVTGLDAFPEKPEFARKYGLGCTMAHKPVFSRYEQVGYEWMPPFVQRMEVEHSTLQQAFVRWFVNNFLLNKYPEGTFRSNTDGYGISFPFI